MEDISFSPASDIPQDILSLKGIKTFACSFSERGNSSLHFKGTINSKSFSSLPCICVLSPLCIPSRRLCDIPKKTSYHKINCASHIPHFGDDRDILRVTLARQFVLLVMLCSVTRCGMGEVTEWILMNRTPAGQSRAKQGNVGQSRAKQCSTVQKCK